MGLFGSNIGPDIKIDAGTGGSILGGLGGGVPGFLAGGFLGNALGGMFSGPPGLNIPEPSGDLKDRLRSVQSDLNTSPEEFQRRTLEGTQGAASALGFDPTQTALSHRASRIFNNSLGDLNAKSLINSQVQSNINRGRGLDYGQQLVNFRRGLDSKVADLQMQAEGARNAMLGQIFGGIGAGVGTYAGIASKSPGSSSSSSSSGGTTTGHFGPYHGPSYTA